MKLRFDRRWNLRIAALAVCGLALWMPARASAQPQPSGPVQVMDMNWLKKGVDVKQAGIYFNDMLAPILKKYGAKIIFVYSINGVMRGDIKPAVTASMEFPSMQSMQALFNDPDYKKIVPYRDATFDLAQLKLFQVAPLKGK